jgi:hypothetical protein
MIEKNVTSWTELIEFLHSEVLFPHSNIKGNHIRSPYVFRGMANSSWGFETSLQRLGSHINVIESPSIRNFRKYATEGTFQHNSFWEVLSIAQHNGLPTRCLDWSASPLIAAHFATSSLVNRNDDAVIWGVNLTIWKNEILNKSLKKSLDDNFAWVYDIKMLDNIFPTIDQLNQFKRIKNDKNEQILFFEPPSIDQKIQNQFGLLSTTTNPYLDQKEYLLKYDKIIPELLVKVNISKDSKSKIRDFLDQNNINERILFPGLHGLCDWLKRYYSSN